MSVFFKFEQWLKMAEKRYFAEIFWMLCNFFLAKDSWCLIWTRSDKRKVHDLHTNASFQRFRTNIRMKILWDLFFSNSFFNLISNIFEQYEEKNLHSAFPRTSSGNESHPLLLYEPLISAEDTHPWEQRVFENERRMVGLSWEIEGKMYILVSLILLQ